jgi:hypothetical protein
MAQSNTKLSADQKIDLKEFKAAMGKNEAFGMVDRVTVYAKRVSRDMVQFSSAIASPDEKKIRPKVGQFCALDRFYRGEFALCPMAGGMGFTVQQMADALAQDLAGYC